MNVDIYNFIIFFIIDKLLKWKITYRLLSKEMQILYTFIENLIKHSRILFFANKYYVHSENYSFSKI